MRLIKMFGLAALAAVAAMAFIGASTASATNTAICTEDSKVLTCPTDKQANHAHFVSTKANSLLLNDTLTVQCISLFLGLVEFKDGKHQTLANPLVYLGNFTYTSCTTFCSATEVSASSTIKVLKTGSELAAVTGQGEVNVNCFGFFNCTYNGKNLEGHGLGGLAINPTSGGPGHVTFVKAKVEKNAGGESCPEEAFLDALFVSLTAEYIRE